MRYGLVALIPTNFTFNLPYTDYKTIFFLSCFGFYGTP